MTPVGGLLDSKLREADEARKERFLQTAAEVRSLAFLTEEEHRARHGADLRLPRFLDENGDDFIVERKRTVEVTDEATGLVRRFNAEPYYAAAQFAGEPVTMLWKDGSGALHFSTATGRAFTAREA